MQNIRSFRQIILEIQYILEFSNLKGHTHFLTTTPQKSSSNEHDRNPIKYLNVLHDNRTQKQLHYIIQDGLFRGCSRMGEGGGQKGPPLPKICHTYSTMIKLGTDIPYLKKIQKIYESRDTLRKFC